MRTFWIQRMWKVREGGTPSPTLGTSALPGTRHLAALAPDGTECRSYPAAPGALAAPLRAA